MKINALASIQKINPDMAAEWLSDRWPSQRVVRTKHVERLASDMSSGKFGISPDAILRIKGKLANGQHRLEAIIKSGKAQSFIVMESNDEELYKVIDCGLRRTASDSLLGMANATKMPAVARWVMAYDSSNIIQGSASGGGQGRLVAPTQRQVIDWCQENEGAISDAVSFACALYSHTALLPISIAGALHLMASRMDCRQKVEDFLKIVYVDGGTSAAGDLRNRLIQNKGSKARVSNGYIFGITCKAFKNFRLGTRPGVLKWVSGEAFPEI